MGSQMQITAARPHSIACQNLENFYTRYQELRQKKQVKTNQKKMDLRNASSQLNKQKSQMGWDPFSDCQEATYVTNKEVTDELQLSVHFY